MGTLLLHVFEVKFDMGGPDNIPWQSLTLLIASSESSSLAASSPAEATASSSTALQALSRIDCRYLP